MSELDGAVIITPGDMYNVKQRLTPKVDRLISDIVGYDVYTTDPRVLKYIAKWKAGKSQDSMVKDNFLENPEFVEGLKQALYNKI